MVLIVFNGANCRQARCLSIKSILLKYRDEILQPPLHLSAHRIEGKLKIVEINHQSQEIMSFIAHFYPTAFKGRAGIVFTHGVQRG